MSYKSCIRSCVYIRVNFEQCTSKMREKEKGENEEEMKEKKKEKKKKTTSISLFGSCIVGLDVIFGISCKCVYKTK